MKTWLVQQMWNLTLLWKNVSVGNKTSHFETKYNLPRKIKSKHFQFQFQFRHVRLIYTERKRIQRPWRFKGPFTRCGSGNGFFAAIRWKCSYCVFILCGSGCITFTGCCSCSVTNRFRTHLLAAPLSQPQQCEHSHWIQYNPFIAAKKNRCRCRTVWTDLKVV